VNTPVIANLLIDVTAVAAIKQRALGEYASQIAYNDFRSRVRGADAARAINIPQAEVSACEAFMRVGVGGLADFFARAEALQALLFSASD
jgi:hypothetical protein